MSKDTQKDWLESGDFSFDEQPMQMNVVDEKNKKINGGFFSRSQDERKLRGKIAGWRAKLHESKSKKNWEMYDRHRMHLLNEYTQHIEKQLQYISKQKPEIRIKLARDFESFLRSVIYDAFRYDLIELAEMGIQATKVARQMSLREERPPVEKQKAILTLLQEDRASIDRWIDEPSLFDSAKAEEIMDRAYYHYHMSEVSGYPYMSELESTSIYLDTYEVLTQNCIYPRLFSELKERGLDEDVTNLRLENRVDINAGIKDDDSLPWWKKIVGLGSSRH